MWLIWLKWLKYLLRADNSNLKTTLTQIIITVIHKSVSDYEKCPILRKTDLMPIPGADPVSEEQET